MTGGHGTPCRLAALRAVAWITLLALAIFLAACRGGGTNTADVRVDLALVPATPAVGPAVVIVQLADRGGTPISGAAVRVVGDMTHGGMAPVTASARPEAAGRYVAEDFAFTMSGDWVLTVQATLPDGRGISRAFDIKGIGRTPAGHGGHSSPAPGRP